MLPARGSAPCLSPNTVCDPLIQLAPRDSNAAPVAQSERILPTLDPCVDSSGIELEPRGHFLDRKQCIRGRPFPLPAVAVIFAKGEAEKLLTGALEPVPPARLLIEVVNWVC